MFFWSVLIEFQRQNIRNDDSQRYPNLIRAVCFLNLSNRTNEMSLRFLQKWQKQTKITLNLTWSFENLNKLPWFLMLICMLSFKYQVDINSIRKFFYQKMVSSTLSILVFESLFSECDSKGFVLFLPNIKVSIGKWPYLLGIHPYRKGFLPYHLGYGSQ